MAKFQIKWSTGKTETAESSDCKTVEQFINVRFGRNFDVKEHGVEVTMVGEKKPEAPKTVVKTTAPKK